GVGAATGGSLAISATHVAAIVAAAAVSAGGAIEVQQTLNPPAHRPAHHAVASAARTTGHASQRPLAFAAALPSVGTTVAAFHPGTAPAGTAAHARAGRSKALVVTLRPAHATPIKTVPFPQPVADNGTGTGTGGAAAPPDATIDVSTLAPIPPDTGSLDPNAPGAGDTSGAGGSGTSGSGVTGSGAPGSGASSGSGTSGTAGNGTATTGGNGTNGSGDPATGTTAPAGGVSGQATAPSGTAPGAATPASGGTPNGTGAAPATPPGVNTAPPTPPGSAGPAVR
ncbi:MAG: polymerase, sigma-24 subunit, subfamily, partial [Conexibacter sp.]|nr:polymerase, sigma-24 subunit, subfamily [Conexibacter sp.]